MPVYKAKQNADTWENYTSGILSAKTTMVRAGEYVVADDLGSVIRLADGRYTKEIWFELQPESPSSTDPQTGTSRNVTITISEPGWVTTSVVIPQSKNAG